MNSKKLTLILAVVLVVSMSASVLAANPFADVPAHHWAYDSIVQLQAVGLIEGYPDGTYGGANTLTRYEAAMVFARALARLEVLVEDRVIEGTADVKEEILAELDAVGVELSELIVAEFEKLGLIDDTVESNAAYVEMVTGRINDRLGRLTRKVDEIAANQDAEYERIAALLSEQEVAISPEVEAVLADLVSELVKEELAAATKLAKETIVDTGVIERIVVDDVDEAAIEAIVNEVVDASLAQVEANLDARVVDLSDTIADLSAEFNSELALLGVRVDELEGLYADVDNRVTALEDQATLSGSIKAEAVTRKVVAVDEDDETETTAIGLFGTDYSNTDALELDADVVAKLNARVGDNTDVALTLKLDGNTIDAASLNSYLLEVASEGTIKNFAFGDVENHVKSRFDQNVVVFDPDNGAVADLALAGFDVSALASNGVLALTAGYEIWPALGFKLTGAAVTDSNLRLDDATTVAAGLFGEVFGVNYDAKVAFDRFEEGVENNMLVDVNVGAEFGILSVDANYTTAGKEFGKGALATTNFFDEEAQSRFGLDAGADLFGIDLAAGTYFENDEDGENVVNATMLNAGYELNFLLPLELSAAYGWKMNETEDNDVHTELKVGLSGLELFGVELGANYTFVNNYLDGNWRDPSKWLMQDAHIIRADLGYGFDRLDLGYDFEYAIPRNATANDFSNQMSHVITADYGFADGVSLNMSAKQVNLEANNEDVKVNELKAGLGVTF